MKRFSIFLTAALSLSSAVQAMDDAENTCLKRSAKSAFRIVVPKRRAVEITPCSQAKNPANFKEVSLLEEKVQISSFSTKDLIRSDCEDTFLKNEDSVFVPESPSVCSDDLSIPPTPIMVVPETPIEELLERF